MNSVPQSIGIDLGTTNSEIHSFIDGHPQCVAGPNGIHVTPSRVTVDTKSTQEKICFPTRVRQGRILRTNPENEIYEPKRIIGRSFDDEYVRVDLHYWPFEIVEGENKKPLYQVTGKDNCKVTLSAVDVDAEILRTLRGYTSNKVTDAVITVPCYFNEQQVAETTEAGEKAGLHVLRCIEEPAASALAFGHSNEVSNKTILVYDLGGGTFDCCIIRINGGKYYILASDGHSHLGGADFDNAIVKHVADYFKETYKEDLYTRKKELYKLKKEAEKAKIALSGADSYQLTFSCLDINSKELAYSESLTRAQFEDMIKSSIDMTLGYISRCLEQSALTIQNIDDVILVGGSTRIPYVQKRLEDYFQRHIDINAVNIDEAVAQGAAIYADALLNGDDPIIRPKATVESKPVEQASGDFIIPYSLYFSVGNGCERLFNQRCIKDPTKEFIRVNRNVICPFDYMNRLPFEFYITEQNGPLQYIGNVSVDIGAPKKKEEIEFALKAVLNKQGELSITIENKDDQSSGKYDTTLLQPETGKVYANITDNEDIKRYQAVYNLEAKCRDMLSKMLTLPNTQENSKKRDTLVTLLSEIIEYSENMDMEDIQDRDKELNQL